MPSHRTKLLRKIRQREAPPQIIDIPHTWDSNLTDDASEYVEALHACGYKNVTSVKHINMKTKKTFIRIMIHRDLKPIIRARTSKGR